MYSQAWVLKADKLMKDLTDLITKKFLKKKNCTQFLGFAVKFDNERLIKACSAKIKSSFKQSEKSKKDTENIDDQDPE